MQTQHIVLGYRIDFYFHGYMLAIEIDDSGHCEKNIAYELKRQKSIEQELGFVFIKIDPGKKVFDIYKAIDEIFKRIK